MPAPRRANTQIAALAAEIREYCRQHADPAAAAKYARYFTEGYDAWGLLDNKSPFWTTQKDAWVERARALGIERILELGAILFSSGKYEEGGLAIHFLAAVKAELTPAHIAALDKWFLAGIRNWAHVDVLCSMVLEDSVVRLGANVIAAWRRSDRRFQRRAVPVALLGLLKQHAPVPPLLEFVEPLMHDEERVVQQGLGWFLREAWKKEPKPVEALLLTHRQTAPRVIYQYATEKMLPEQRARFRRSR